MKIVILDGYAVNPGDLSWDALKEYGEVTVYDRTSPEEVAERAQDAEIVLTNKVVLGATQIDRLPKCKYIGVLATGYNIVDTAAAARRGIIVTNIPGYSTQSVAQNAISLLLAITNHTEAYSRHNREGRWSKCLDFCYFDYPMMELDGKTFGVVGYGSIGKATARVAAALGMKIITCSSKPQEQLPEARKVTMEQLFAESDVVSLHCPLTPDTDKLVNKERLVLMKPTAILLNTARGALVDEQALADALNDEKIFAAGLDVLSTEPPKSDNPLLRARNCYITPHISWATVDARKRLIQITADNIKAWEAGNAVNVVD